MRLLAKLIDLAKRHPIWATILAGPIATWIVKQLVVDAIFGSVTAGIAEKFREWFGEGALMSSAAFLNYAVAATIIALLLYCGWLLRERGWGVVSNSNGTYSEPSTPESDVDRGPAPSLEERVNEIDSRLAKAQQSIQSHGKDLRDRIQASRSLDAGAERSEREVFLLLSYAVHVLDGDYLTHNIEKAPYDPGQVGETGNISKEQKDAIESYIRRVEGNVVGTRWQYPVAIRLNSAESNAERTVRETEELPASMSPFDFRVNVILQEKYRGLIEVLKSEREELKAETRHFRGLLTEQLRLRKEKG